MSAEYSEDILVQQTTADFFEHTLKWHCVYAYNQETFGIDGTLGRKDKKEIVLKRYLREALAKINPGHPQQVLRLLRHLQQSNYECGLSFAVPQQLLELLYK
jgi:type I restriction enzyme R subunit